MFWGCSDHTITVLCARLKPFFLSVGDILVEEGSDADDGIFFVRHGYKPWP
jgi:hypothetical protein